MEISKTEAIVSLMPNSPFMWRDGALEWLDETQTEPTDSEIDAEVTRLQGVYDGQAYARLRKAKYDLLNQDEMRYDDTKNSTTTWVDAIDAIKAAHPKP
jgi:hypothetical protein